MIEFFISYSNMLICLKLKATLLLFFKLKTKGRFIYNFDLAKKTRISPIILFKAGKTVNSKAFIFFIRIKHNC
jgi:hypothetical protein